MKPYYEHAGITIYHGDCREILSQLDSCSLIIADPPYNETSLSWDKRVNGWLPVAGLRLASFGSLWCFGSFRFFMIAAPMFESWNFAQEVIWEKQNGSGFCVDRFNRVHELVTHWYRGKWADIYKHVIKEKVPGWKASHRTEKRGLTPHRGGIQTKPWNDNGERFARSIVKIKNEHLRAEHPTQKPIPLLARLIEYSSLYGDCVLDPFMGSGSTLLAAKRMGRNAIGIEIEEKYCEIAAKRLSQEVLQFSEVR